MAEEEKNKSEAKPTKGAMPPASTVAAAAAAAPFLAWPPLLLHPWAPALLPGAWCSPASAAALRSALPGSVIQYLEQKLFHVYDEVIFA